MATAFGIRECPECGRRFDLMNETDAEEWAYGHDCEVTPRCDLCGEPDLQQANGEWLAPDWNGETGNHLTCEAEAARKRTEVQS